MLTEADIRHLVAKADRIERLRADVNNLEFVLALLRAAQGAFVAQSLSNARVPETL
jgi:hypothetical protein